MFEFYKQLLKKHPLLTKSTSCFLVMFSGDVACQRLEKSRVKNKVLEKNIVKSCLDNSKYASKKIDYGRTVRFSCVGAFYIAPMLHLWYGKLGDSKALKVLSCNISQFLKAKSNLKIVKNEKLIHTITQLAVDQVNN